jgi:hypothetical protein
VGGLLAAKKLAKKLKKRSVSKKGGQVRSAWLAKPSQAKPYIALVWFGLRWLAEVCFGLAWLGLA